jgi:hypothetical protein
MLRTWNWIIIVTEKSTVRVCSIVGLSGFTARQVELAVSVFPELSAHGGEGGGAEKVECYDYPHGFSIFYGYSGYR